MYVNLVKQWKVAVRPTRYTLNMANGDDMQDRQVSRMQSQQSDMDSYIRNAAGSSSSVAEEISKLGELQASGVITADEFAAQKAKLLA